ncbi:MAG: tetratricopeptide repeat protein [Planctomycetia bacterium]|nr:tetratricopeptide repeat protein [Planctomycetia bacterium]
MKTKNKTHSTEKLLFVCVLIFISTFSFLLYVNATHGKFVYDDFKIIVGNSFIKQWSYLPKVFTKDYFALSGEMSYRPLVTISYFIDYAIWHVNPFGFHLTNVVLHIINTVLFYLLLRSVLPNNKIIFLSILFFVTHPLLGETVNAVGYREDLLSAAFLLVSFIYFIKSDSLFCSENSKITRFSFYYTISLVAYLCALFSKEMAITLPALLILFVMLSHQKPWLTFTKRLKGIYAGYLAISLFYLTIRFVVLSNPASKIAYQAGGFWINTFTMIKIVASYIKLSFFPVNLNADYVVSLAESPSEGAFVISFLLLISIFIIMCKTRHICAFWMAWFFVTLLPVMNILPIGNIMAERYLYIPVMGFCAVKGILIYRITDRTLSPRAIPLRQTVQLVLVTLMLGGYGFSVIRKNGMWRDEFTLWTKTITRSPNSYRAHCNLGNIYIEIGLVERAYREYQTALRINPEDPNVHSNLGNVYSKKGLVDKACEEYAVAIHLDRNYAQPHNNLGNIYFHQGSLDKARMEYEEALRIKPDYALAHNGLGNIYNSMGYLNKAMEEFKKSLHYDSRYAPAMINLGVNYAKRGQLREAVTELKKAVELDNNQSQVHYNLGLAYEKLGKQTEAINEYNIVIQLDSNNLNALYALGSLYKGLGLADSAIHAFQRMIILSPDIVDVHKNLIFLYLENKNDREMTQYYLKELLRIDPSQAQNDDIKQVLERFRASEN